MLKYELKIDLNIANLMSSQMSLPEYLLLGSTVYEQGDEHRKE